MLDSGRYLTRLCFSKKDGSEIAKFELETTYPYGQETVLEDDEEIIGIHGNKSATCFKQLGFIVWKPPKF